MKIKRPPDSSRKRTLEEFISDSKAANGEHFDYSLVEYKNAKTKVDIICPVEGHGVFSMLPLNRTRGQQCPKCAQDLRTKKSTKTHEQFIEQCAQLGVPDVSFENVVYQRDHIKVNFTCAHHGSFWMVPCNFLQGQRCPACAKNGYSHMRSGRFYVLSDGATTKIGVTHRAAITRAKEVLRSGGPDMRVIADFYFKDGAMPTRIESACLKYLKACAVPVSAVFDGSTECFLDVDINALLSFITPLVSNPELEQSSL